MRYSLFSDTGVSWDPAFALAAAVSGATSWILLCVVTKLILRRSPCLAAGPDRAVSRREVRHYCVCFAYGLLMGVPLAGFLVRLPVPYPFVVLSGEVGVLISVTGGITCAVWITRRYAESKGLSWWTSRLDGGALVTVFSHLAFLGVCLFS